MGKRDPAPRGFDDAPGIGSREDFPDELLMQRMATALHAQVRLNRKTQRREIAEEIEQLVTHEFIAPAQPTRIQDPIVVEDDCVV